MGTIKEGTVVDKRQAICKRVERIVGYPIIGLGDILSILTSPDILPLLDQYVEAVKATDKEIRP